MLKIVYFMHEIYKLQITREFLELRMRNLRVLFLYEQNI